MGRISGKSKIYATIITGVILGALLSFSPGSLFILFASVGAGLLIYRFLPDERERNLILALFFIGLGARIIFTLLTLSVSIFSGQMMNYAETGGCPNVNTPYIISDSGYTTLRALFTKMYWYGEPLSPYAVGSVVKHSYGFSGFIYLLAAFFSLFGYSPVSSIFINCFLGSLTAILVYSMVKNIFNERPARLAAILTAFFPSTFLWSITNLKDATVTFLVCLMLWSLIKFEKTRSARYLIVTALSIWIQTYIRQSYAGEFVLILIAMILFYIFYLLLSNLALKKRIIIYFLAFFIAAFFMLFKRDAIESTFKQTMTTAYHYHAGTVGTEGISYRLLPDRFYRGSQSVGFGDFLKMLGRGWFHIMLEPLPANMMRSKAMLYTIPQMFLWYFLIFFAILGIVISARYKLKESGILIAYFLITTSILAVTGGNVGTVFRLRDVNTPLILMFSTVGLFNTFSITRQRTGLKGDGVDEKDN